MSENPPYLYLLMRNDLPSMNPGKAVAQGAHAATMFMFNVMISQESNPGPEHDLFNEWVKSPEGNHGFGTKISLSVSERELNRTVDAAHRLGALADIVVDPSYPYIVDEEMAKLIKHPLAYPPIPLGNGNFACHRREFTCGYVFGRKDDVYPLVSKFPLMP